MNADVNIDISVASRRRNNSLPFRPTITYNQEFHYKTDLTNYLSILNGVASDIITYVSGQRALLAENITHIAVKLDNPTHPPTAKGVVKLPKGHWDVALSDLETQTTNDIVNLLQTIIGNLKNTAKY